MVPAQQFAQNDTLSPPRPSLRMATVKSVLLPGLGEFDLGETRRGRILSYVELALWISILESRRSVTKYESQIESFAGVHAGAKLEGKDNQFRIDIGQYLSMDEHNQARQRARQPRELYSEEKGFGWAWDKKANQEKYRRYRFRRYSARRVGQFLMGGMVLNRIISVIDVTYLYKRKGKTSLMPHIQTDPLGPQLTWTYTF